MGDLDRFQRSVAGIKEAAEPSHSPVANLYQIAFERPYPVDARGYKDGGGGFQYNLWNSGGRRMPTRAIRPETHEMRVVVHFGRRRVRVTALWQICTAEARFWPFLPFSPPLESVIYRKIVENAGSTPAASTIIFQ
jgi:hypothetical protein